MSRPSYEREAGHWRLYQPHLPHEVRLEPGAEPDEEWWERDGGALHLDRFVTPGARTTVVVLHGGGGYGRLLASLGRAVTEAGHEVVLPDLPGYGLTEGDPAAVRYEDWVACAVELSERERARGNDVVLFGLSMGGMLALHAAAAAPPGAVAGVAATTLMDPRRPQVRRGAGRVPAPAGLLASGAADRLRVPMRLLAPLARMSAIPAVNALCRTDPQGGGRRVALGLLRTWMTYTPAIEPEAFDRCPVLLAHPLADRWTPVGWSRETLERIPGATRFVGLERCEHWPLEQPGLSTLLGEVGAFAAAA